MFFNQNYENGNFIDAAMGRKQHSPQILFLRILDDAWMRSDTDGFEFLLAHDPKLFTRIMNLGDIINIREDRFCNIVDHVFGQVFTEPITGRNGDDRDGLIQILTGR